MTTALVESAMESIARNREQHLLVVNPSEEIDSLVEFANALARTATSEQRPYVHGLIGLIRRLCESNRAELACERTIAAALDDLEHATRPWSLRRAAVELRPHLATLCQPFGDHDTAREQVRRICRSCPQEILVSASLAHELGKAKTAALVEVVA